MDTRIPLEIMPNSGVTAGSYGPSADATPGYGVTFDVPYMTVDAKGRVTEAFTRKIKIPASDNTDTKVKQTVSTDNKEYPVLTKDSNGTTTTTAESKFAAAVTVNPSTGTLTATKLVGDGTGINVGSTANKPVVTTTSGKLTTGSFGTAANTFCEGNDSRLSDARTPTSHTHGNITNDGKVGTTSGLPLITTTGGEVTTGSFGTSSGTFCEGNDSRLSDARTPTSHTHGNLTNDGKLGTASAVVVTDSNKKILASTSITTTELGYLDGVTSAIQTQLNGKAASSHEHAAGDITSGTLADARIPNLAAGKITSGTFDAARIPNLDASKITSGTIDIARIPAGALERLVIVADQAARFALTATDVQIGDTVKQEDTGLMYYVVDISHLDSEAGYEVYTAGAATSVPWSGVTDKPDTFPPSSHTHAANEVTAMTGYSKPSSTSAIGTSDTLNSAVGKLEKALDGKAPTSHASTATTYGASSATNYGHAMASSTTPKVAGTATLGDEVSKFARGDHVHPAQTSVSGNAGTATKFASNQTVALTGDVTGSASSQAGWSVATTLSNSGVTADTYGSTTQQTPAHGATFDVPYVTVDAKGRVTAAGTSTVKLPADQNTDTKVTQTVSTDNAELPLLAKDSNGTTTTTASSKFAAAVKLNPSTGTVTATKFSGPLAGNASSATEFSTAKSVTLTGDVTGTASSKAGWSVATTLSDSGVTAGTIGETSQQTPTHGGTFNIPYVTVDTKGRVTAGGTTTVKLPTDSDTNTKVTQTVTTTSGEYPILAKNTTATATITDTSRFASGVTLNPSTGTITATKFKGGIEGNADTATKFASAQTVALTGDVTGSASSQAGWSVATTLSNSGVTADTYGNTSQQTPSHGGTFNVPYVTVDAKGRVTAAGTATVKLPTDQNTDTKVTQTVSTDNAELPLLAKDSNGTTTVTASSKFAAAVKVNPSTGTVTATKFSGNGASLTSLNGSNISSGTVSAARIASLDASKIGSGTFDAARIPSLDASKITSGTIDIARLPSGALERLVVVADETARFALTTADVQLGDTVKQEDTGVMYYVKDTDHLDSAAGYEEYTAGAATSVPWSGVTDKPSTFPPSSHNHGNIANDGTLATANAVVVTDGNKKVLASTSVTTTELGYLDGVTSAIQTQLNGKAPTSHASTATTYGVSSATNYGHAMASSTTPIVAGTAAVGSETTKFARGDHVHPAQTTITGNAGTATKFASAQSVTLTGDVTGTASSQAGWSVATTLANSGVTAGRYTSVNVDAKGRVTAGNVVHTYTTAASAAKNWYRIANASTSQTDISAPLHAQFLVTAYNTAQNADYYEQWFVDVEVFGRQAGIRVFGASAVPFSQVRVLYENTLADVSSDDRPAIDLYLNYVIDSACTVKITEVYNSGWTFLADGVLAASTVPTGFENRAQGPYANGITFCNTADYASYFKLNYTNISANTTLAVNDTYAKRVLNCTGTITVTVPTGNANTAWFIIKNNGTGVITVKPASTSVYFDNVSANITLQPREFIFLSCQSSGHYSIIADGRWKSSMVYYGTCSTAAGTAAKTVACTDYVLTTGSKVLVKFTNTNTAANPTLNVNGTGAKAIYVNGAAIAANRLQGGVIYELVYNGTQYDLVDGKTSAKYTTSDPGTTVPSDLAEGGILIYS